ncbi:DUF4183 domain-containing protein [Brevibacillus sp. SAFN-007a]|uniref:DUF4183 domain-containing protein n=1 Tax=Brevibacillus sp. SAFN-007a TaxID=3436862 RepID=UPI003F7D9C28
MLTNQASNAAETQTKRIEAPLLREAEPIRQPKLLRAECHYFCAISDGTKLVYTDEDACLPYSTGGIVGPEDVSVVNLFINGLIQPPVLYEVAKGRLRLLAQEAPAKDATVILQFIAIASS